MDRRIVARGFGIVLFAAATLTWTLLAEPAAALGLAAMGTACWMLLSSSDVPSPLASDLATATAAREAQLVRDLQLAGRGVHVPSADGRVRLFIPASSRTDKALPPLTSEGIVAEGAAAVGLSLRPPGQAFYDAWIAREGAAPQGRGAEEAADHIRRALPALGLGARVKVSRAPGRLRIEYAPTWTRDACAAGREDGSALQLGCPTCSLVAMLAAQAMQAPVRYGGTQEEVGAVLLDLEDASNTAAAATAEPADRPVGEARAT